MEVLMIIGGLYMACSILPALLMSAIAFLMTLAQIALFKALSHSGIKTDSPQQISDSLEKGN